MQSPLASQVFAAHKKGTLLAHIYEGEIDGKTEFQPENYPAFFDVMAGKKNACHVNGYHNIASIPEGCLGLATTALKAGHPVALWSDVCRFGLLMDADDKATPPCFVSSRDGFTDVQENVCAVKMPDSYPELRQIQGVANESEIFIPLNKDRDQLVAKARKALARMWEFVDHDGWPAQKIGEHIFSPLNEVTALAHLTGVKGIVIDEAPRGIIDAAKHKRALREACKLRDWLSEHYPETFPEKLPIFSYHMMAKDQLVELNPKQLRGGALTHRELTGDPLAGKGRSVQAILTDMANGGDVAALVNELSQATKNDGKRR